MKTVWKYDPVLLGHLDHLATAVCLEGRLVWHVYIEPDDGIPF